MKTYRYINYVIVTCYIIKLNLDSEIVVHINHTKVTTMEIGVTFILVNIINKYNK